MMKLFCLKLPQELKSLNLPGVEQQVLSPDKKSKYANEIAEMHFKAWGKFQKNKTLTDWQKNWLEDENKLAVWIVVDDQEKLLGTVSLKKENMDRMFPDFFPWLAGLYVVENSRNQGVGKLLINAVVKMAKLMNYEQIYLFTHFIQEVESYYRKWGRGKLGNSEIIYRDAPVLLMVGKTDKIIDLVNN